MCKPGPLDSLPTPGAFRANAVAKLGVPYSQSPNDDYDLGSVLSLNPKPPKPRGYHPQISLFTETRDLVTLGELN